MNFVPTALGAPSVVVGSHGGGASLHVRDDFPTLVNDLPSAVGAAPRCFGKVASAGGGSMGTISAAVGIDEQLEAIARRLIFSSSSSSEVQGFTLPSTINATATCLQSPRRSITGGSLEPSALPDLLEGFSSSFAGDCKQEPRQPRDILTTTTTEFAPYGAPFTFNWHEDDPSVLASALMKEVHRRVSLQYRCKRSQDRHLGIYANGAQRTESLSFRWRDVAQQMATPVGMGGAAAAEGYDIPRHRSCSSPVSFSLSSIPSHTDYLLSLHSCGSDMVELCRSGWSDQISDQLEASPLTPLMATDVPSKVVASWLPPSTEGAGRFEVGSLVISFLGFAMGPKSENSNSNLQSSHPSCADAAALHYPSQQFPTTVSSPTEARYIIRQLVVVRVAFSESETPGGLLCHSPKTSPSREEAYLLQHHPETHFTVEPEWNVSADFVRSNPHVTVSQASTRVSQMGAPTLSETEELDNSIHDTLPTYQPSLVCQSPSCLLRRSRVHVAPSSSTLHPTSSSCESESGTVEGSDYDNGRFYPSAGLRASNVKATDLPPTSSSISPLTSCSTNFAASTEDMLFKWPSSSLGVGSQSPSTDGDDEERGDFGKEPDSQFPPLRLLLLPEGKICTLEVISDSLEAFLESTTLENEEQNYSSETPDQITQQLPERQLCGLSEGDSWEFISAPDEVQQHTLADPGVEFGFSYVPQAISPFASHALSNASASSRLQIFAHSQLLRHDPFQESSPRNRSCEPMPLSEELPRPPPPPPRKLERNRRRQPASPNAKRTPCEASARLRSSKVKQRGSRLECDTDGGALEVPKEKAETGLNLQSNTAAAGDQPTCTNCQEGQSGKTLAWGLREGERDRMVYVSWLPRIARAESSQTKRCCELHVKTVLQKKLIVAGLQKVLLYPPSSAHCKLLFSSESSAKVFLSRYGGREGSIGPEVWKRHIAFAFAIDVKASGSTDPAACFDALEGYFPPPVSALDGRFPSLTYAALGRPLGAPAVVANSSAAGILATPVRIVWADATKPDYPGFTDASVGVLPRHCFHQDGVVACCGMPQTAVPAQRTARSVAATRQLPCRPASYSGGDPHTPPRDGRRCHQRQSFGPSDDFMFSSSCSSTGSCHGQRPEGPSNNSRHPRYVGRSHMRR